MSSSDWATTLEPSMGESTSNDFFSTLSGLIGGVSQVGESAYDALTSFKLSEAEYLNAGKPVTGLTTQQLMLMGGAALLLILILKS